MYKVEWNKEHTWKILKFYKEGKINKIRFEGVWYKPVVNTNSYECDEFGNRYVACDGCDDCALVDICHNSNADNPIGNACDEFGMSGPALKVLDAFGLNAENIVKCAQKAISLKK